MASEACCKRAPVGTAYVPRGQYESIAGFNTYVTGSRSATRGIIDIFDIFGFAPQTTQGADLLAEHTGAVVLLPDYFHGEVLSKDLLPVDSQEKREKIGAFIQGPANVSVAVSSTMAIRTAAGEKFPSTGDHWGVFGLCWGGKVAAVACTGASSNTSIFTVVGTAHPGHLSVEDTKALEVPYIILASPEESEEEVSKCKEVLEQPGKTGEVETYSNMFHGWMGARAKLDDEDNLREFCRGYEQVGRFFARYLG